MPTPQIPSSTAPMPWKHISHSANTSHPLFNSPHALKSYFTQWQHLKPPFQLPSCPQNTFHPMPTPQTPFSAAPMPSENISPSANTSDPLFNSRHALKTYFTQCQHLKPHFQLPPCSQNMIHPCQHLKPRSQLPQCPENIFHPMRTPEIPFSTAPMPSNHISPNANTSDPLFNCCHALESHLT